MNIIYLMKNNDKESFPNKYIGMKTECGIIKIDGNDSMVCMKTGRVYTGSSYNPIMIADAKAGNTFSVEVLEVVAVRKELSEREAYYIDKYDAVASKEYYNLSNSRLDAGLNQESIGNCFGETLKERATGESARSKRDATAASFGFSNYGEFSFYLHEQLSKAGSAKSVSDKLGKHRHFAARFIKDFDMEAAVKELPDAMNLQSEIRKDREKEATLGKLKELYGFQLPTLRVVIGDYGKNFNHKVAKEMGLTKEELEVDITRRVLDGDNFEKVSKDTGVQLNSVKRYFLRCVRSRLKSCDL
jgi:hypothetical protein